MSKKCYRCGMKRVPFKDDPFNTVSIHFPTWENYNFCGPCFCIIWRMCIEYCDNSTLITSNDMVHNGPTKYNKTYNSNTFYNPSKDKELHSLFQSCEKCKANLKRKIKKMIKNGRKEITTKEELEKNDTGSLISYINVDGVFKSAGFLIKATHEYFVYITPDLKQKYRVRYFYVSKMWIGDPFKVSNDIVSIVESPKKKTNFPIKIGNVIVYYAQDPKDMYKFRNTDRYERYIAWYKYFIDSDFNDKIYDRIISFGKHQGKTLDWLIENDKQYCRWAIENIDNNSSQIRAQIELLNDLYNEYEMHKQKL